jgi:hypothetical protein
MKKLRNVTIGMYIFHIVFVILGIAVNFMLGSTNQTEVLVKWNMVSSIVASIMVNAIALLVIANIIYLLVKKVGEMKDIVKVVVGFVIYVVWMLFGSLYFRILYRIAEGNSEYSLVAFIQSDLYETNMNAIAYSKFAIASTLFLTSFILVALGLSKASKASEGKEAINVY